LISQINEIGKKEGKERDKKLKELLAKSFPVIKVKSLRPMVMSILSNTQHIEEKYLKVLVGIYIFRQHDFYNNFDLQVRDQELYNDANTEVKRQIWKDNQSLFGDEVSPLLSQYIREKEKVLFDHENLNSLFFSPSPKVSQFSMKLMQIL
jgi:negative elongation factor B